MDCHCYVCASLTVSPLKRTWTKKTTQSCSFMISTDIHDIIQTSCQLIFWGGGCWQFFLSPNNIEKAVGILTCSCIGESGSLFFTSVQCFCCLSFLKCYIWNTYVFLLQYHRKKNGEGRNKKEKITKKSINTCYSQVCGDLGSEVPAGKVRTKNLRMLLYLHRLLLAWMNICFFFFHFLFYIYCLLFHLILSQSRPPSPSVISWPRICSLQRVFSSHSLHWIFVFSKLEGVFFFFLPPALECSRLFF